MYRAIELVKTDRDLHRFVWRRKPENTLQDYRMTRLTFGVSASCFAANMAVKRNAIDHAHKYPLAAEAVEKSFYVDDGLSGDDDVKTAITFYNTHYMISSRLVVFCFASGTQIRHVSFKTSHLSCESVKMFIPSLVQPTILRH